MDLPELAAVHDQHLALSGLSSRSFASSLAGRLLLRAGFDPEGIAAVIAASVAGAASLSVDADPDDLREGLRAGFCDFVVSQTDEALRILKNELRRGRPVAVGLSADPASCLSELIDRGLQPDLVSPGSIAPAATQTFLERGAVPLLQSPSDAALSLVEWTVSGEAPKSMPAVAHAAMEALDPARSDSGARRRWLEHAPAFLGRAFGPRQCVRMAPGEMAAFRAALRPLALPIALSVNGVSAQDS